MSNTWDLKRLRDKREEVLKAELAAWLHDWKKCSDEHLKTMTRTFFEKDPEKGGLGKDEIAFHERCAGTTLDEIKNAQGLSRGDFILFFDEKTVAKRKIELCDFPTGGLELDKVLNGKPQDGYSFRGKESTHLTYPILVGRISHHRAHFEKELEENELETSQCWPHVLRSTSFGFELGEPLTGLTDDLKSLKELQFEINKRKQFLKSLKTPWERAIGDTRRPINEVTLWDWSSIVAALYKAEIARCVLTGEQRPPKDIRWRLLSIRTNGLEYLLSAPSIPDLKVRQELLQDAWNRVQNLLEEEYPLALEVYRDENGPVFVVPDIDNLLGLTDSERNARTLRELILERFRQGTVQNDPCLALQGEIVPDFLDKNSWDGQSNLPPIGKHLKKELTLQSDAEWVAAQWCNLPTPQERCTVCGLRPQGPSPKARRRGRCDVCEKRRVGRAERWATQELHTTIWLDEVADHNGRIALLVGSFDLTYWLDGTLVRSLAVRNPENCGPNNKKCPKKSAEHVAKNPSFARLRRIWETTRKFWEETLKETEGRLDKRPRIFLKGRATLIDPKDDKESLAPYHAYELEIQGRKVAVLWVPEKDDEVDIPERYRGGFWVIENLEYLASQNLFGRSLATVLQEDRQEYYEVYEPTEYGRPGQPVARFYLESIQDKDIPPYTPLIPILAEPRTFMALVPANKAFEVMQAIKTKYEREMGRVRNRLPLHLGVVFADSHQPLRTILDAGRRMLKQGPLGEIGKWYVSEEVHKQVGNLPMEVAELAQGTKQFDEWYAIHLEHKTLKHRLTWYVPAVMGDGRTEDHWYPFVFWVNDKDGNTHPGKATKPRHRYYQVLNPFNPDEKGNPQSGWLVHAAELQPGDRIYFTPATFDFIFLDHGGRRFEIAYDEEGHRRGALHRPYLLDEIVELEACWERLKQGLHSRQIHQIRDLIETKRREWFDNPRDSFHDPTFREFCRSVLVNAEWRENHHPEKRGDTQRLTQWAVSGLLADAVELFYHIMKQRPVGEADEDTGNAAI